VAAQMYPERLDESTVRSHAEQRLYEAFRDQLPDTYHVFHSVAWLGVRRGRHQPADGEADFVVAHPQFGILVLEVKGGMVGRDEGGEWYSISRDGRRVRIKDPFDQVRDNKYALLRKLRDLPNWPTRVPSLSHGVAFPDGVTALPELGPDAPRDIILFHSDLQSVETWVRNCMGYWTTEHFVPPGESGMSVVRELLARSWALRPPRLGERIDADSPRLAQFTAEQFALLRQLDAQPRAAIRGCAGSGKTMLAVQKSKQLVQQGFRVLLTCYNRRLAEKLRRVTEKHPRLYVQHFHGLCRNYAAKTGFDQHSAWDETRKDFFNRVMPEALLEAAATERGEFRFDAVVVDEGQDFEESWWSALELLLEDPHHGVFYVFYDDNQLLYGDSLSIPFETVQRALTVNCRNTQQIHKAVLAYYRSDLFLQARGPEGRKIELGIWPADPLEQRAVLTNVLADLVYEEGVDNRDIVVLGPTGLDGPPFASMPVMHTFRLVASEVRTEREIQCTSVRLFKGLESPVIVLVALSGMWKLEELMYVGLSRAQHHAVVMAEKDTLDKLAEAIEENAN
jgi:hypothetical protein